MRAHIFIHYLVNHGSNVCNINHGGANVRHILPQYIYQIVF